MVDKDSVEYLIGGISAQLKALERAQADATVGLHIRLDKVDKLIPQVAKNTSRISTHGKILWSVWLAILGSLGFGSWFAGK